MNRNLGYLLTMCEFRKTSLTDMIVSVSSPVHHMIGIDMWDDPFIPDFSL